MQIRRSSWCSTGSRSTRSRSLGWHRILAKRRYAFWALATTSWASAGRLMLRRLGRAVSQSTKYHSPSRQTYFRSSQTWPRRQLRANQVLPLIPCWFPRERQRELVKKHLDFAPAVAIDCISIEELDLAKRRAERALAALGRNDSIFLAKNVSRSVERSPAQEAIQSPRRGERRCLRIEKQSPVAGSKYGIRRRLKARSIACSCCLCARSVLEFEHPHFQSQAEVRRRGRRRGSQQVE